VTPVKISSYVLEIKFEEDVEKNWYQLKSDFILISVIQSTGLDYFFDLRSEEREGVTDIISSLWLGYLVRWLHYH
jgi:hypothetical protein